MIESEERGRDQEDERQWEITSGGKSDGLFLGVGVRLCTYQRMYINVIFPP